MIRVVRKKPGRLVKEMIFILALAVFLLLSCQYNSENAADRVPDLTVTPQRLVGQWVRPDGGYVLEINRVRSDGRIEARYLNPRPIHVETAELKQDEQGLGVFIELRDRGYPGSYYELTYNAADDHLTGTYFQATQRTLFEVVFLRRQSQ